MNLLGAKHYDPGTAASAATTSLLAMTAFDTSNLRIALTAPAHGFLRFRIVVTCVNTAAAGMPAVLLGVMNSTAIIGRASPINVILTATANRGVAMTVDFIVGGLSGSYNFDAAYAVQVVQASTGFKWGGPNDTTGNDAWGAFVFEIYDPQPQTAGNQLAVDSNGRVDISKISGTTQTARDIGASVLLSSGTGTGQLDFTSGVVKANATQIEGADPTDTIRDSILSDATRFAGANINATIASRAAPGDSMNLAADAINDAAFAAATGKKIVRSGTLAGAASASATLDSGASATNSIYLGNVIVITGGPGVGQARTITAYVGSTKLATVDRAWITTPTAASTFAILPTDSQTINSGLQVSEANSATILSRIGTPVSTVSADIAGVPSLVWSSATRTLTSFGTLVADVAAAVWAAVLEVGFSASRILRAIGGAAAGKSSGGGTAFRNLSDTDDAIVGTVDPTTKDRTSSTIGS